MGYNITLESFSEIKKIVENTIDFEYLLIRTFSGLNVQIKNEKKKERVIVNWLKYFKKLNEIMKNIEKTTLEYYLAVNIFDEMQKSVDKVEPLSKLKMTKETPDSKPARRFSHCYELTQEIFDPVFDRLYGTEHYDQETDGKFKKMFENLKIQYIKFITETKMINEFDKGFVKLKINHMTLNSGFLLERQVPQRVAEEFKQLKKDSKNFFEMMRAIQKSKAIISIGEIGKLHTKQRNYVNSRFPGISYIEFANLIRYPAVSAQWPHFSKDYPDYILYAITGYHLAHEMTHAMCNTGRDYYFDGEKMDWLLNSTRNRLEKYQKCLFEQYDKSEVTTSTKKKKYILDGKQTEGENFADNIAVKIAYDTWMSIRASGESVNNRPIKGWESKTPQQMFFYAFSSMNCESESDLLIQFKKYDPHALNRFRVQYPLRNLEPFSESFGCKKSDVFAKSKKCLLA